MVVRYHARAWDELVAAAEWYERELPGLGMEFQNELEAAIASIVGHPDAAPPWSGLASSALVRGKLLSRFPFAMAYVLRTAGTSGSQDTLFIAAVAHQRGRSGSWRGRPSNR